VLSRETLKAIDEIDQALDKGLSGVQAQIKGQKPNKYS